MRSLQPPRQARRRRSRRRLRRGARRRSAHGRTCGGGRRRRRRRDDQSAPCRSAPRSGRPRRDAKPRSSRCVGANVCVGRALRGVEVACVVNPATGREERGARGRCPGGDHDAGSSSSAQGRRASASPRHRGRARPPGRRCTSVRPSPAGTCARSPGCRRARAGAARSRISSRRSNGTPAAGSGARAGLDVDSLLAGAPDIVVRRDRRHAGTRAASARAARTGPVSPGREAARVLGLGAALEALVGIRALSGARVLIVDETRALRAPRTRRGARRGRGRRAPGDAGAGDRRKRRSNSSCPTSCLACVAWGSS